MALPLRQVRLLLVLLTLLGMASCNQSGDAVEGAKVKFDFEAFRRGILSHHAEQVITYLPQNVSDYLAMLNAGGPPAAGTPGAPLGAPGVNLLLRTALDKKVAPALRAHLDLQLLLQRLADRGLLDSREIRGLSLGRVEVRGERASAELYFRGNVLPLRLPFVKQDQVWKVDLLAMLPYAELLMRLDRAVTGKTESQQVAQLVEPLPLL
jgi:hypothetical protein